MILDAIIALFVSLFGIVFEGVALIFVPVINLILAGIEAVVGLFVAGFSLTRIERKKKEKDGAGSNAVSQTIGLVFLVGITGMVGWFLIAPKVMNREIGLVAEDGHSLPFAALIITTDEGEKHLRTDNAGNIVVSRFGLESITIKDPRYVEQTWDKEEIEAQLIVRRTLLGSGLDSLADRLMKPAKEE